MFVREFCLKLLLDTITFFQFLLLILTDRACQSLLEHEAPQMR
uniref:Uncharacterized protein n=1 Tax=Anguilla anguilla TaxID=7936 RepID=A0A0E9UD95_ANGAN